MDTDHHRFFHGGVPGNGAPSPDRMRPRHVLSPNENTSIAGYSTFLRGVLENPRAVSTPLPSGVVLANKLAFEIDPLLSGMVVELGPGTGVITDALIRRGVSPDRLILVETNRRFCEVLTQRFPGIKIVNADAWSFERYLDAGASLAGVLSSLPLLNFAPGVRKSLIVKALELQGASGRFVQLSYGWRPAIPAGSSLAVKRTIVWRNVPPAHIWTFTDPRGAARPEAEPKKKST